mgnify:CR=1 FL=1
MILLPPREGLYERCDLRFERMMERGAVEEVEAGQTRHAYVAENDIGSDVQRARQPLLAIAGGGDLGALGMGIWGMAPAYSNERFPTAVRGVGAGFCYHAAAAIGAMMPWVLGELQDRGFSLVNAMSAAMVLSAIFAMVIWLGPETRGREFTS